MSKKDAVEKRREADPKPKVLFTVQAKIWDDGIFSGRMIENAIYGREKVKIIYNSGEDFLSAVRSIVPSAIDKVEELVNAIDRDAGTTEKTDSEVAGMVTVDVYSNGVVATDFSEMIQGALGRPKAWRRFPEEFLTSMRSVVGTALEPLKLIGNNGGVITAKGKDEAEDEG